MFCARSQALHGLKEPGSYVTVGGLRFKGANLAEYSSAGHLPILHYRRTTGIIERLSIEQFPIGMIPSAEYYAEHVAHYPGRGRIAE